MLQELLNLGLVEIGSDDSRFKKMQSASTILVKRFEAEPHLLIPATLVALDEDVDEDDPFFILVEEIVTEEWKTLRNTHSNRPRQLLRSVSIDALATLSTKSAEVSSIIYNTAASVMRHQQTRLGKAAGLIGQLIAQAYEKSESEAIKRAGMSSSSAKRKSKKTPKDSPPVQKFNALIKEEELLADVARAAGPQYPIGQPLPEPNPHWSNAGQPWTVEFNPRMTTALVKAVNLGTSRLAKTIAEGITERVSSLDMQLSEQINAVEELLAGVAQSNASGLMRLDILWWSEALYSPLLKKGYRDLSPPIGALGASIDLTAIVPPLVPSSVSYILAETVGEICRGTKSPPSKSVEDYLKVLASASPEFRDSLPQTTHEGGRGPLVELLAEAIAGNVASPDIVRARTGIEPELRLTPADFAMWIFREIQARRLVEELS